MKNANLKKALSLLLQITLRIADVNNTRNVLVVCVPLKHNPAGLGANDCKSFLTAKISRIAELSIAENGKPITLGGHLRPQLNIITAIFGILRVRKSNPDCTGFEPNATAIEMT